MPPRPVFIGLGSNIGDRLARLQAAVDRLRDLPDTAAWRVSPVYETAAVDVREADAGAFLNAVAACDSGRPAPEWLVALLEIEREAGRTGKGEHRSRTLDLDLLACGDEIIGDIGSPGRPSAAPADAPVAPAPLVVPHPRLAERWFVLRPLVDLAAEWIHPVARRTARELLEALRGAGEGTRYAARLV